jgi:hypothetical protein
MTGKRCGRTMLELGMHLDQPFARLSTADRVSAALALLQLLTSLVILCI